MANCPSSEVRASGRRLQISHPLEPPLEIVHWSTLSPIARKSIPWARGLPTAASTNSRFSLSYIARPHAGNSTKDTTGVLPLPRTPRLAKQKASVSGIRKGQDNHSSIYGERLVHALGLTHLEGVISPIMPEHPAAPAPSLHIHLQFSRRQDLITDLLPRTL